MRLRVLRNKKTVGDYPDEIMKIPENMIKIIKNHLLEDFDTILIEWYDENKTK